MVSSLVAGAGRVLFALLFIASGLQKLTTYEPSKGGGAVAHMVSDKLQTFHKSFESFSGLQVPLHKEYHQYALLAAIIIELVGASLFLLDFAAGAVLLLVFLFAVTPVIHDFWNVDGLAEQQLEGAQFFKNLALVGALLFYLAKPRKVKLA